MNKSCRSSAGGLRNSSHSTLAFGEQFVEILASEMT